MDQDVPKVNLRRESAAGARAVVELIERNIASGVWKAGDRLPAERELEVEFGTARNTLRKGLRQLEANGAIIRHVGRGTFVAARPADQQAENFIDRLKGCSPAEVMEVRLMVEPRAAEMAAARANQSELALMEDCVRRGGKASDVPEFEHWDGLFHKAIIDAARNTLLSGFYEIVNTIRNQPEWSRLKLRSVTPARRLVYQGHHEGLVRSMIDRDTNAARDHMIDHLVEVRTNLLGSTP